MNYELLRSIHLFSIAPCVPLGFYLVVFSKTGASHIGYVGLNYNKGKWNSFSQVWAIDLNNGYGLSQTVSYQIAHKTQLRGFINKTLSTGNTNMTLGVYRAF